MYLHHHHTVGLLAIILVLVDDLGLSWKPVLITRLVRYSMITIIELDQT